MVVAWLGPADTEAADSLKSLLTALNNLQEYSSEEKHFPDDDHLATLNLPRRDSRAWNDLNLMLDVSYFSRVWIIQELAVSSKFQLLWGDITISEDEYESLKNKILFLSMTQSDGKESCPDIRWKPVPFNFLGKEKWDDKDLLELVQLASGSKATYQQDKIYALIGLAGQRHYNVQPDYSKPESEVFADFATRVISTNENLDILNHAYVEDPNEPECSPLWAPRWQTEDNAIGFLHREFKASKDSKAAMKPSRGVNHLELRGLEVDVVKAVHHRSPSPEVHQDVSDALEIIENNKVSFEKTYKLDAIKVIILTMMAGREIDVLWVSHPKRPKDESYLDNFIAYAAIVLTSTGYDQRLFELLNLALKTRGITSIAQDEPNMASEDKVTLDYVRRKYPDNPVCLSATQTFITIMRLSLENQGWHRFIGATSVSHDHNFFITEKGYVGVGPRCMKAGDKVCVLFGGSTAYVIRPTSTTDEYLYLGPAYVHEIMDGEVIDAWEKDKGSKHQEFQEKFFKLL
ncbi:hypothetical protein NW752_008277 [Fusarium irregulare]|nr:hypothetical protein NW752_008277 [Fusarium irregulare]